MPLEQLRDRRAGRWIAVPARRRGRRFRPLSLGQGGDKDGFEFGCCGCGTRNLSSGMTWVSKRDYVAGCSWLNVLSKGRLGRAGQEGGRENMGRE